LLQITRRDMGRVFFGEYIPTIYQPREIVDVELLKNGEPIASFAGGLRLHGRPGTGTIDSIGVRVTVAGGAHASEAVCFHKGPSVDVSTPHYQRVSQEAFQCFDKIAELMESEESEATLAPASASLQAGSEAARAKALHEGAVCRACGAPLSARRAFCTKCGAPADAVRDPDPPEMAVAQDRGPGETTEDADGARGHVDLEHLAVFGMNGRQGFVRAEGDGERLAGEALLVVIEPRFEQCYPFSEGLAAVKLDGRWGYINGSGTTVIPHLFDEVSSFQHGAAVVRIGERNFTIDTQGRLDSASGE
jgi:hypothetical protein